MPRRLQLAAYVTVAFLLAFIPVASQVTLDHVKNGAIATVSTGYDASATTVVLTTGHGARMPSVPFRCTWWNSTDYARAFLDPNVEVIRVTALSTDTATITRAVSGEGTTAHTHNTGGKTYTWDCGLTAGMYNAIGDAFSKTTETTITGDTTLLSTDVGRAYHVACSMACAITFPALSGLAGTGFAFSGSSTTANWTLTGHAAETICRFSTTNCATTQTFGARAGALVIAEPGETYWKKLSGDDVTAGGSGATAALDNLASVSINTALLAQTGVDLGSTVKPFRDLYLFGGGTYGTNYFKLTGTPTGARVITLPNLTSTLLYSGGPGGTPSSIDLTNATNVPGATVHQRSPGLRLTTETAVCVSTSDRTSQGTIYYTPCASSYLALYSGSAWVEFTQAELSLSLTATSANNYDVFACYNSGTPNLALSAAWTNATTRADALARQNGMLVKSSDHTCLLVGTIRASGSNVVEDSVAKRFVANVYNLVFRDMYVSDTSSAAYDGGSRQWNADAANQLAFVAPVAENAMPVEVTADSTTTSGRAVGYGIGLDSTSTLYRNVGHNNADTGFRVHGSLVVTVAPQIGYHYVAVIQSTGSSGSMTTVGMQVAARVLQ